MLSERYQKSVNPTPEHKRLAIPCFLEHRKRRAPENHHGILGLYLTPIIELLFVDGSWLKAHGQGRTGEGFPRPRANIFLAMNHEP